MPSIPSHFTKEHAEQLRARNREVMRKWRLKHPEKAKERNRRYRVEHREAWIESYRKSGAKYRAKDPERWRELCRARSKNPHAIARKRKYTKEHSAEARQRSEKWNHLNPDRRRAHHHNAKIKRRAALKVNGPITDCTDKLQLLNREKFCHWCCVALTEENRSIDHVTPIARGGQHHPDNLVAACMPCNMSKGRKLISEWTWKEAA